MEKIYKCFVSSTYSDLEDERKKAFEAILDLHNMPVGMEHFNAADESQWDYITKMLEGCDYFILIVGGRYGSIAKDGESYTEKETRYARKEGIPVLAFLLSDEVDLPQSKCEKSPENAIRLKSFREWLKNGALVKFWKNKDELRAEIIAALTEAVVSRPRPGYSRGEAGSETRCGVTMTAAVREPRFEIEFSGKKEIRIDTGRIPRVDPIDLLDAVRELTPLVPFGLEKHVTERAIEEWNAHVPEMNRLINFYNAEVMEYNQGRKPVQLPFVIQNTGTAKATEIAITMEFPEWMRLAGKDGIQKPVRPDIGINPVRAAMNRLKPPVSELIAPLWNALNEGTSSVISAPGPILEGRFGKGLAILTGNTAQYEWESLRHGSYLACESLYISPPSYVCEGILKISCHCDELFYPQEIDIPLIII